MSSTKVIKAFATLNLAKMSGKHRVAYITTAANSLKVSPNQLVNFLREHRSERKAEDALRNARVCYRAFIA